MLPGSDFLLLLLLFDPQRINFFVLYTLWKYMYFLFEVLTKETTPSFQFIFFGTLYYNENCKIFWSSTGN